MTTAADLVPGYIDPPTGRVAVEVEKYFDSDLNGDQYAYLLDLEAEAMGMERWRLVDGVDQLVDGDYEIWGSNIHGGARGMQVPAGYLLFLPANAAALLGQA